ncbi:MAG: hypothetical protein ACK5LC_07820 [Coprobacillaceae bacterium]
MYRTYPNCRASTKRYRTI